MPEPGDRTQLRTPAFGLAASRFPRRLLGPSGDPAPAGRAEPGEGDERPPPGPRNCTRTLSGVLCCPFAPAELPPTPACVRPNRSGGQAAEEREGDRISISSHRVTGGSAGCRVGLFVVVFNPGTSNPFSDQRALPVLKEPGWSGGDFAPLRI